MIEHRHALKFTTWRLDRRCDQEPSGYDWAHFQKPEKSAVDPIMEIALGFILWFLAFLSAFRVLLNSINRLVNIEKDTHTLEEVLTALEGSAFRVYSFPFILLLWWYLASNSCVTNSLVGLDWSHSYVYLIFQYWRLCCNHVVMLNLINSCFTEFLIWMCLINIYMWYGLVI
jgi:hypothetical protein